MNYADKFQTLVNAIKDSDQSIEDKIINLEFVEGKAKLFIGYINSVYERYTETPKIKMQFKGQEYRDAMEYLIEGESIAYDAAISACSALNRRCQFYDIEPFFVEISRDASEIEKRKFNDFIGQFVIDAYHKGIEERQQIMDEIEQKYNKEDKTSALIYTMDEKLDKDKAFKGVSNPALSKLAELEDLSHLSKNQFKALDQALTMENLDAIRNMKEVFLSEITRDVPAEMLKRMINISDNEKAREAFKAMIQIFSEKDHSTHETAEQIYETKAYEQTSNNIEKAYSLIKNLVDHCQNEHNTCDLNKLKSLSNGTIIVSKDFEKPLMNLNITNIETGQMEKIENIDVKVLKDYSIAHDGKNEFIEMINSVNSILEVNKDPEKGIVVDNFDGDLVEYVYYSNDIQKEFDKYKDYLNEEYTEYIEDKIQKLEHEELGHKETELGLE